MRRSGFRLYTEWPYGRLRACGLLVMTSPLQGEDSWFDSGQAHHRNQDYIGVTDCPYHWTHGLVGYDVAFTRRRSPVRIRLGPLIVFNRLRMLWMHPIPLESSASQAMSSHPRAILYRRTADRPIHGRHLRCCPSGFTDHAGGEGFREGDRRRSRRREEGPPALHRRSEDRIRASVLRGQPHRRDDNVRFVPRTREGHYGRGR